MKWILSFLVILIIGCGREASSKPSLLEGVWKHPNCQVLGLMPAQYGLGFFSFYSKSVVEFDGSEVKYYQLLYSDSSCMTEIEAVLSASGKFSITSESSKTLDFTWDAVSVMPKSQQSADTFNAGKLCGYSGWVKDQAFSVKGSTCSLWDRPVASAKPVLQVYDIEGGRLWLGDSIFLQSDTRYQSTNDRFFEK